MEKCISYESKSFEVLLPSPIIFSTLCISYDKTELFIISFIRLLTYIILYYLLVETIDIANYPILNYIMYVVIGINIIYIGLVVSKRPVYSMGSNEIISKNVNINTNDPVNYVD